MYYLTLVLLHLLGIFIHLQTLDLKPFVSQQHPREEPCRKQRATAMSCILKAIQISDLIHFKSYACRPLVIYTTRSLIFSAISI